RCGDGGRQHDRVRGADAEPRFGQRLRDDHAGVSRPGRPRTARDLQHRGMIVHRRLRRSLLRLTPAATCAAVATRVPNADAQAPGSGRAAPSRYDDLVTLFTSWRAFQQPKAVNGVPDYSPAAM